MEEEKLEKTLSLTKKGFPAMWVQTNRYATPTARYGQSSAICTENGKLSKIIRTKQYYTKVKQLVRITSKSVYIQSHYSIEGSVVEIYKIEKIDYENKKIILDKVATFKDNKWDTTAYVKNYKEGVHSTLMRAKKIYTLRDLD
jgi:hypothetical protein